MSGGDLQEYIRKNTDADRPVLVGDPPIVVPPPLTPISRYLVSLAASVTSTPAMLFMGTSREYVAVLSLVLPPH